MKGVLLVSGVFRLTGRGPLGSLRRNSGLLLRSITFCFNTDRTLRLGSDAERQETAAIYPHTCCSRGNNHHDAHYSNNHHDNQDNLLHHG